MSENYNVLVREVFAVLLFAAIFVLPWWIVMLLGVGGILIFDLFVEVLVVGWYIDVLFNPGGVPQLTLFLAITLIVVRVIKAYL